MADRDWTKEQALAIRAQSGAVLVSAAAGSGKTSVLVERIVRMLTDEENACPPQALLVVTFTNAAALEMRTRIAERIRTEAERSPERSDRLFNLAARLGEMFVGTMDAFCMQLVRENFNECGVEPDFTVLDEGEETALQYAAVKEVLEALYAEDDPGFAALTSLFESGRDDGTLIEGILSLSDFSMSEPDPAAWLNGVQTPFLSDAVQGSAWEEILRKRWLQGLSYCLSLTRAAVRESEANELLRDKTAELLRLDEMRLNEALETVSAGSWDASGAALVHALEEISSRRFPALRGMAEDPVKLCVSGKRNRVKETLKKLCGLYCASSAEHAEDIRVLAPAVQALVRAVLSFQDALLKKKRERGAYGFADISHFALSLLYDPAAPDEKTPLARELTGGYKEILIDEYQDTNRAQDKLFSSLSENGENMFMVGDVKQSIYRFRLASPEIFTEKCRAYPNYDGVEKKAKITLGSNFRSRHEVTRTVNYLFSAVMSRECGDLDYTADERLCPAAVYPEDDLHATEFYLVQAGPEGELAAEAAYCAKLIKKQLAAGLTVYDKEGSRPAGYGDFCILLRSAKNTTDVYARALRRAGIPVNVDTREGFFETAEIRLMLSFLRVIDNPLRDVDLLAVMLSPLFGFSVQDAAGIRSDSREKTSDAHLPLYDALTLASQAGQAQATALLETLQYFRRISATASADELIGRIYDETLMLHIAGAKENGAMRVANLHALQETAVRFSADALKTVGAFLRYLDMLRENDVQLRKGSDPGTGNSVRIMTIHRSKGLEFPFVIVGGLSRQFNLRHSVSVLCVSHEYGVGLKRREPENIKLYDTLSSTAVRCAAQEKDLSEELRIYYVALTRAREKLFFLAGDKNPYKTLADVQAVLPETAQAPPYYASGVSTPLEWFVAAFLRHPDAKGLRTISDFSVDADFPLRFEVVSAEQAESETETAETKAALPDETLVRQLTEKLHFTYRYLPVANALAKHTASALAEETFSPLHFAQSAPAFMYRAGATPADVGTATHKFLEYCDFSSAEIDVEKERARLVAAGRLKDEEAQTVDAQAIGMFFASDVFARVLRAQDVIREREFTVAKSICELDPSVPAAFSDEQTVVIGKMDLVFIEDGKAVILDYKTDKIGDINELRSRYAGQLALYAEAVEKAWGYPVKEKILYSLHLRQYLTL